MFREKDLLEEWRLTFYASYVTLLRVSSIGNGW
jgi:hypothetical protein